MKSSHGVIACGLTLLLGACSDTKPASKSQLIGPSGGTLAFSGGSLVVPAHALAQPTMITVDASSDAPPAGFQIVGSHFRFGPDGLGFLRPAQIRFDNPGTSHSSGIYWSTPHKRGYERLRSRHVGNKIIARVSHFSDGFVGTAPPATPGASVDPPVVVHINAVHIGTRNSTHIKETTVAISGPLIDDTEVDIFQDDPNLPGGGHRTLQRLDVAFGVTKLAALRGDLEDLVDMAWAARSAGVGTQIGIILTSEQSKDNDTTTDPPVTPAPVVTAEVDADLDNDVDLNTVTYSGYNDPSNDVAGIGTDALGNGDIVIIHGDGSMLTETNMPLPAAPLGVTSVPRDSDDGSDDTRAVFTPLSNGTWFAHDVDGGKDTTGMLPAMPAMPLEMDSGDLDNDGASDVVYADANGSLQVLSGDGAGGFVASGSMSIGNVSNSRIHIDDANADGNLDVVVASPTGITTYLGQGDGTFGLPVSTPLSLGASQPLIDSGDLDGDGIADFLVAGDNGLQILRGGRSAPSNPVDMGTPAGDMATGHAPPTITDILPTHAAPGSTVVLSGTNLGDSSGDDMVTFNGVAATSINYNGFGGGVGVVVPNGTSNGTVTWTNKWGTGSWSGTFQVMNTPVITNIAPASGPTGTLVVFTGTHFENLDPLAGGKVDTQNACVTPPTSSGLPDLPLMSLTATSATLSMPALTIGPNTCTNGCAVDLYLLNQYSEGQAYAPQAFAVTGGGAGSACP